MTDSIAEVLNTMRGAEKAPVNSLMEAIFGINGKTTLVESFEVYSIGENGERAKIPTTDSQGKSKYSDAASAAMQKIKLEKDSPGKHWTIVSVKDDPNKDAQRTSKQQATGSRKDIRESLEESLKDLDKAHASSSNAMHHLDKANKFPEGSLKNAMMAAHHKNMNTYHENMTDYHLGEAKKAEASGNKQLEKIHTDEIKHHQDEAASHREKHNSFKRKIKSS